MEAAALAPEQKRRWGWLGRASLPFVVFSTLAFELALAERKYALFGGGFGQSRTLDQPFEILAFFGALFFLHFLLFYLLFRLVRRLHGRLADSLFFHLNFALLAGGGGVALVIAKHRALAYFSDAMNFRIVRNLGGGSLADALLFSLSEIGLALFVGGGLLAFYAGALVLLRRRRETWPLLPDRQHMPAPMLGLALAAAPFLLFAANRIGDARPALARFNAVSLATLLLEPATDPDGDGWSLFSHPVDLHPFDGARHPYALDIPGNGIDEDGFGGDLAAVEPTAPEPPVRFAAGERPHVILIVLESIRADLIGRRIDGRPVAPTIERLAAHGSHAAAYSHVGFTTQSLQSLFTGRLAPRDDRQSLVRDFQGNGYRVGIFSGQSENFGNIAAISGMRRADIFVDANSLREERSQSFAAEGSINVDGRKLLREFDRHFGAASAWARPNFLYFNFQSAHFPYHFAGTDLILTRDPIPRGEIGPANRARLEKTYWNAAAYNDRLVAALLARLERLGQLERSLVVITADHGESLFDDGFLGHGHALNPQQTRIPLVLSRPDVELEAPIGLADMRAIILRAAGAFPAPARGAKGVFQYLGDLDRPGAIGLVQRDGHWVRFDLFREALSTSDRPGWTPYARLDPAGRAAAHGLIDEWARQRWRARPENQP